MSHLSKYIFATMALLVLASVGLTFWRTMVMKNFEIVDDVEEEALNVEI